MCHAFPDLRSQGSIQCVQDGKSQHPITLLAIISAEAGKFINAIAQMGGGGHLDSA